MSNAFIQIFSGWDMTETAWLCDDDDDDQIWDLSLAGRQVPGWPRLEQGNNSHHREPPHPRPTDCYLSLLLQTLQCSVSEEKFMFNLRKRWRANQLNFTWEQIINDFDNFKSVLLFNEMTLSKRWMTNIVDKVGLRQRPGSLKVCSLIHKRLDGSRHDTTMHYLQLKQGL